MAVQTFNDRSLDAVAMAAESLLPEENSFTILSSELMLKGDYLRDGDDLIIRGDLGEEIRVEEYFSADVPPTLETPYGAVVLPETVQKLLVNVDSFEVAGPAGSLSIPGLLGDPIGTIDELGGDAQATAKGADGVVRTLNEGDPIYQDDVIETIGRSFANLRMLDDTSFQLGKETRAIIENYNYTPGVESGQFEATVISGFFRYASGKLGGLDKGTHTTIKTPTAQIGVRGSEMEGIIEEDGSSTFVHKDGILDVSDANGRGTVTLDEPGMATAVSSKPGAPATAFEAPASLLATFEEALPPPPDFVVTHDEEEAEGEGELLAQQAALVDGEGEEEGEGEGGEEPLAPVVEVVEVEEEVKVEEVQQNAVPTAFNDLLTGEEDGIVTGTLASNDQLGDGKHTWFVAGQPEHGTVVISADGSFTYTPDPNYNGVDSFTYTIRDVDGDESTAQVIVSLSEVNDAPVLMVDGVLVFKEGDLPLQGQLNVTDVDNTGDQLLGATITINNALATDELSFTPPEGSSIQAEYVVENGVGTLILTGAGSYADYQDAMLNVLFKSSGGEDPTQNGLTPTRSITWTVTENDGSAEGLVSEPFTLDVNITPVNNPPTLSGEPTKPVPYGSPAEASKALFPSLDIDPIEDWQTIQRLVFSVTGVTPGDAQEMLLVGSPAEAVPLVFTQGVVTELADGTVISYGEGNDGRLLISMEGEWNQNEISDFIRSIRYQNDNPNPVEGNREIALELVIDDGGNEFGGVDTAQLSGVSATVAVLLPPTLSVEADVIPQQQHFYETSDNYPNQDSAPSPVQLFPLADSQAAVFGLDDGNQNVNQLVVRVEGVALDDLILLGVAEIDLSQNMTEATAVPFTSLPEFQYQVVEAMDPNGDPIAGAKDLVLTGDWSSEQLISLINDLKFTNVGDDPDVSGANPTRKISIQTLRDDGGSLGVASDDAVGLQDSALSTVINVYSINDLPYHTDGVVTYEYAGEQTAGLFAGATATPVELSGTITELVLSITNLSSEAAEQLIVGGTAINLVGEASGSVSSATNSVANYDYEISPIDAVTGQAVVTLTGSWNSAEISELISGIAYSSSESILAQSRTIKVERIVDDQGGQYVSDNLFTVVKSPANQPPTLTVESGDPAQDVVFYEEEDADGGGAYVSVFDGLTFASSAGLNEDSIQNIGGIKVVVQNVVAGDWIRVHGTVISLTDDTGANLSADDYSFKYAIDYDPITKTTEIKLSPDSMEWNSGDGSDEVDALLQSIEFMNDGVDPAPDEASLSRIFTITEISDLGDNPETTETDESMTTLLKDTTGGEIVREVVIDPYNQSPSLAVEDVIGTESDPARYSVSGEEVGLFSVWPAGSVTAVEGSQNITLLTFTVNGIGGILSGQDGSNEWISVNGEKISLNEGSGNIGVSGANEATLLGSYDTSGFVSGVTLSADGSIAFVADGTSGLQVFDIKNPSAPSIITSYSGLEDARDIALSADGGTAYIADGDGGLKVIDVSIPSSPVLLGEIDTSGSAYGVSISGDGGVAYVADYTGGLKVFDISSSTTPKLLTTYESVGNVYNVQLSEDGNTAYIVDYQGLKVLDVSAPSTPALIGSYDTPDGAIDVSLSPDGTIAYIADGFSGVQIVDIHPPADPVLLGRYNTPGSAVAISLSRDGNFAYIADTYGGFHIIDVASPSTPILLDSYYMSGARSVTLENGAAYVADGLGGLKILDLNLSSGDYTVSAGDTADSRVVTLNGNWSPEELDDLIDSMSFGLSYNEEGILQGSGVRTITLTEIQDDGGSELDQTNDTTALNISATVDVMVDADGGVTVVNRNDISATAEEKSAQYFSYDEPLASVNEAGVLLGGADQVKVDIRLSGVPSETFVLSSSYSLFKYETDQGTIKLELAADGTLRLNVKDNNGVEKAEDILLQPELEEKLFDGQVHDLTLQWKADTDPMDDTNLEDGAFLISIDDVLVASMDAVEANLGSNVTETFLEPGGVLQIGAPGFSGNIHDIQITTGDKIDSLSAEDGNVAHWEMDKISDSIITDSYGSVDYQLVVKSVEQTVDTILVKEAVDIGELEYLFGNQQFTTDPSVKADINNLQIDLSDVNETSQSQILIASDVLELGFNKVEVFGDATGQLDLQGWVQDTTDATHYTFTSTTSGEVVELFVQAEVNANVNLS